MSLAVNRPNRINRPNRRVGAVPPWAFPEVLDYWDAGIGITQGTATERVSAWAPIKGSDSLAQATAGNQPILLPYAGTNYLWLPGVASNNASAPNAAANQITGDIGIVVRLAPNSVTPAGNPQLLGKWGGTNAGYRFLLWSDGRLFFDDSPDGSANNSCFSSTTIPGAAFADMYLAVARVSATGVVRFYTSTNGVVFTQLGTDASTTLGSIFASTRVLDIGDAATVGKIYRAQLYNGIPPILGGSASASPVFDANFTGVSEGATSFTESSSNGATVTINSTGAKPAYIVGSQIIAGDAAAYFLQGTFTLNAPYFVVEVGMKPTWASGQVSWDGKTANSFALQDITASPQQRLHDGSLNGSTKSPVLSTWYVKAATQDASGNATFQLNLNAPTADTLSHTAMAGFTAFADGSGANFASGMKKAIAVGNVGISQARLNQLIRAMAAQHNISV